MSGHSKWKNIMHKKEKADSQRAGIFTKIGKEIMIAVREAGPNPASNFKLASLIAKARAFNVPNDNIERVIKKASGDNAQLYEVVVYEGYGIGGVAVIVETTTDNRNRTASEIRHFFDKFGGNMGTTGCVSFMFADKGVILIDAADVESEDKFMEDALDCGVIDFSAEDDYIEIFTDTAELEAVKNAIENKGYKIVSAETEKIPNMYVKLDSDEQIQKITKMLDMMENNDDVQNVWHNWDE